MHVLLSLSVFLTSILIPWNHDAHLSLFTLFVNTTCKARKQTRQFNNCVSMVGVNMSIKRDIACDIVVFTTEHMS